MKQAKKKQTMPSGQAALVTALGLLAGAAVCIVFYTMTSYLPLLLAGILQALPAVANLLLMIPILPQAEEKSEEEEISEVLYVEPAEPEEKPKKKKLAVRMKEGLRRFWANSRENVLLVTLLLMLVGVATLFWMMYRKNPRAFAIGYHIPVILIALFVFYIVLDKWCKHAGDNKEAVAKGDATAVYDRALLHGLRGALTAARWSCMIVIAALVVRLLKFGDYVKVAKIALCLLFFYEVAFLFVSLMVRYIRHELSVAPELSIPMPGLGGEDLGVISYLETNTGITMRSLWSIRLIKAIVPYSVLTVLVLLWGFSGVVKIEPHQQGAHYRLGRLQQEVLEPGMHMTLPWPFDTVEVYDTEVSKTLTIGYISEESTDNIWTDTHGTTEYKLLLGGGAELVSVNLRVVYHVEDLRAYLSNNTSPELLAQSIAYEILTARTIGTDLNTLLATDRSVFADSFKAELIERMATYQTGLCISDVVLESIHPPVDIADVYQKLISAGVDAERIVQSAIALRDVKMTEAESRYYTEITLARIDQIAAESAARAAVAEFLAKVEVEQGWAEEGFDYKYHKYLEAITAAYANGKVVIVGEGVDQSNIYIGNVGIAGVIQ